MDYDLMLAARKAFAAEYENRYAIAYDNVEFTPPGDGSMWLAFHYVESEPLRLSLDRKCVSYMGMVQINVTFAPGTGTDKPRKLAKEIADFFKDGKILGVGYIYEGASVRSVQKSETGWIVPIRFVVRVDTKGE